MEYQWYNTLYQPSGIRTQTNLVQEFWKVAHLPILPIRRIDTKVINDSLSQCRHQINASCIRVKQVSCLNCANQCVVVFVSLMWMGKMGR